MREKMTDPFAVDAPLRTSLFSERRYVEAVAELAQAITQTSPRPAPRRWLLRVRLRVAIALAVALCLPVASAVGYQLAAHTGIFGVPGQTENDTSEWLRSDAPDFGAVVARLIPSVALPHGASWRTAIAGQVKQGHSNPGLVQVTGVRSQFEAYARCAWIASWLAARQRDDLAAQRRATSELEQSVRWPATVATDGGGTVDHYRALAQAANVGDATPLERELPLNCSGFDWSSVQ
jgi:hypothetical protein